MQTVCCDCAVPAYPCYGVLCPWRQAATAEEEKDEWEERASKRS